jgi:hypothetical protein
MTVSINVAFGATAPVLIPCPIPPSFTAEVWLGECTCFQRNYVGREVLGHNSDCASRPVKVACSIGGDGTWAGSEVVSVSVIVDTYKDRPDNFDAHWAACRARWEIVKALVTGEREGVIPAPLRFARPVARLFTERDTMFAKLAKIRTYEDGLYDALGELPGEIAGYAGRPVDARFDFAARALASYVASLIASVGTL